ncbi:MAG: AGE family epimerase/isomerase [Pirellulaceae bacterium]|nr:AGE family epimerase/isomerase [Pirellulaceae bacterium]
MLPSGLDQLIAVYRDGLLNDTLPFWIPRAIDRQCGGYITSLDRDGSILQTDKAVWFQGRFAWLLATLYNTVERRPEWLELARHGIDFINQYGFDTDGRMFFWLTRDGRPLRKRRYLFSEAFAVISLAAYGIAAEDDRAKRQALDLFRLILRYHTTPGLLPAKVNPATRAMKGLAMPMILIATAQELRKAVDDPITTSVIDRSIDEIERDFLKPEFRCVLEAVGPHGEFLDTFDGRLVCPGHAIEAGWFILEEARVRNRDPRLVRLGTTIVDWSLEIGWDQEFGGLLYYRDAKGLPCSEYWHDMKFWWPHNEAIIATLLAWQLTGDPKYAHWHQLVHDWSYAHFPDSLYGEWYGYLHRDGTVSTPLKGNMWKGPFHLPRMQWYCWQRLAEIRDGV